MHLTYDPPPSRLDAEQRAVYARVTFSRVLAGLVADLERRRVLPKGCEFDFRLYDAHGRTVLDANLFRDPS